MAAVAGLFGPAESALATYPGANGKIYFSGQAPGDGFDVWSVNPDGSGLENITDVVTDPAGEPNNATTGGVSGDGSRLVFSAGTPPSVWISNSDGTGAVDLTPDANYNQSPDISADGTRIVWGNLGNTLAREIWVMNVDGSGKQLLVDDVSYEALYPVFTPDGQTVVHTNASGVSKNLAKVPSIPTVPTTVPTPLTSSNTTDEEVPTVSPDGQSIVFAENPAGPAPAAFDLVRIGINGGPTTPLVTSPDVLSRGVLSPDGTKLAYNTGLADITVSNADGSAPAALPIAFPAGFTMGGNPSWAANPAGPPDTVAPETVIDKKPKRKSTKRKAVFRFSSNEPGATFQCKLDKKPFAPCTSPKVYKKLKPKKHKFSVFATDAAGNADTSRSGVTFKVNDIK
jgi:Tol biopolymer transport system component